MAAEASTEMPTPGSAPSPRAAPAGGARSTTAKGSKMRDAFNYSAPAELFFNPGARSSRKMSYRRFPTAAEAIAFAVEEIGSSGAGFTTLQVDEQRFERQQIKGLYDDPGYPLERDVAVA